MWFKMFDMLQLHVHLSCLEDFDYNFVFLFLFSRIRPLCQLLWEG